MAVIATPLAATGVQRYTYRLDIQLGFPKARLEGALEWWLGDPGLCKGLDQHPYCILLEIDSARPADKDRIVHAVDRICVDSGPMQLLVSLIEEIPCEDASLYQVMPSAGLRDLVLLLSRAFPVIVSQGTLACTIGGEAPGSFMAFYPHRPRDPARSQFIEPKREGARIPLQARGAGDLACCFQPAGGRAVPVNIFRIALRENDALVAEYDLVRKEWLSPSQSRTGREARSTLRSLRTESGFQMRAAGYMPGQKTFVISDLHLGHVNSIARYKRPFFPGNIREMDRVLIRNWNWTVKESDTVFYLGDLSYKSEVPPEEYLRQLAGDIVYIEGNHDPAIAGMHHCVLKRYRGVPFLLIHNPDEVTRPFPGWIVYGHVHNKDLSRYPFFDPANRRINVSAEMVGYRPVSFDEIHQLVTGTSETLEFRNLPQ